MGVTYGRKPHVKTNHESWIQSLKNLFKGINNLLKQKGLGHQDPQERMNLRLVSQKSIDPFILRLLTDSGHGVRD